MRRSLLRGSDNAKVSLAAGARRGLNRDLDISSKKGQKVHEPFGGEAGKLTPQKAGDFRLIDFEYSGGLSLGEPPRANGLRNADRKASFGEALLGVRQTDVGEYVPATFFNLNSLAHLLSFLSP